MRAWQQRGQHEKPNVCLYETGRWYMPECSWHVGRHWGCERGVWRVRVQKWVIILPTRELILEALDVVAADGENDNGG